MHPLSAALQTYGAACNRELHGSQPSTGLLAVLFALSVCEQPVDLYGFWPFCCTAHGGWPRMNYKYAHTNRTQFVCCSKHREKFEVEFGFYRSLERLGLVHVASAHASVARSVPIAPPGSVPSEAPLEGAADGDSEEPSDLANAALVQATHDGDARLREHWQQLLELP